MPYFVYAVRPFGQLQALGEHAAFKEASNQAKALRVQPDADKAAAIRVMFAASATEAEDLLLQIRDPRPTGDE